MHQQLPVYFKWKYVRVFTKSSDRDFLTGSCHQNGQIRAIVLYRDFFLNAVVDSV